MTKEQVFEKVRAILVEYLGVEPDEVTLEASLIDDLGGDSIDQVEIITAVDDEFDITLADEELYKLTTVKAIVDQVLIQLNQSKGA